MNEVYRIIVSPYHYDTWSLYTTDTQIFHLLTKCYDVDDAQEKLGSDVWEAMVENFDTPAFPYIMLGETVLRQRD